MTGFAITTEAQARHLMALRTQGLTYPQIIEREGIPLDAKRLRMRLNYWQRKLADPPRPLRGARSVRLGPLPAKGVIEEATAYHQRVLALGRALCHCCHHRFDEGGLFCGAPICRAIVARLRHQERTSQERLCGCPEVIAFLARRHR